MRAQGSDGWPANDGTSRIPSSALLRDDSVASTCASRGRRANISVVIAGPAFHGPEGRRDGNPLAVDVDLFADALERVLSPATHPSSPEAAAASWADAFDAFCSQAEDESGEHPAEVQKESFQSILATNFATGSAGSTAPTAAESAQAFADAFEAYWDGASFQVGTPPSGEWSVELSSAVIAVTGTTLKARLRAIFESLPATPSVPDKAREIAEAFGSAVTTDVTVLISGSDTTPPPSGPLPITSEGTLS